jgi:acetoacetyl-CoA synthetase
VAWEAIDPVNEQPLWQPSEERVARANLTRFLERVRAKKRTVATDYAALYRWSLAEPEAFWGEIWEFCGVVGERDQTVVDDPRKMPGARWFPGARLNFAENLLRFDDDREALVAYGEWGGPNGHRRAVTYGELRRRVARAQRTLQQWGVESGDRVAGFLPNLPETVIAMLATTSLGAVWSSCSQDFGVQGVLDRFGQIRPKVLIAADGYHWAGKRIDSRERIHSILQDLPTVEKVVIVPFLDEAPDLAFLDTPGKDVVLFQDFLDLGKEEGPTALVDEPDFPRFHFDHPLYILYSSGTTGLPKCMVHGAGGTLIQHLKELVLHTDLTRDDRIFYYTTCGWMMWNWLVSSLAVGATVVLYDGSPFHTAKTALFDLVQEEKLTVFGTSAKYLALAEKEGLQPRESHDLSALRTILSTGSPLLPGSFDYVYRDLKADVCLASISGGTDLISCFALGNPIGPVWRGELQVRGLGMAVEVWDADGKPRTGRPGELVCTQAFPSMPVRFWDDPEGERYRAAYFEKFSEKDSGVWCHGDWVELTRHGGLIVYGRSDATLNPGGVRIGTAEIYRQVEPFDDVLESLVVGQSWEGDERILLFVRLRPGKTLDNQLIEQIRQHIRANTTPRHVPAKVLQVEDIPRTVSGKVSELAVSNILHGREVDNTDALANPESLEIYRRLAARLSESAESGESGEA